MNSPINRPKERPRARLSIDNPKISPKLKPMAIPSEFLFLLLFADMKIFSFASNILQHFFGYVYRVYQ